MIVSNSYLCSIKTFIGDLDGAFRDRVCSDCGWSIATFYRKIKDQQSLTSAERLAIQNIAKQFAKQITSLANKEL